MDNLDLLECRTALLACGQAATPGGPFRSKRRNIRLRTAAVKCQLDRSAY